MNNQNLKPFNTWPPDEHRAASIKGGHSIGPSQAAQGLIRAICYAIMDQLQAEGEQKRLAYNERKRQQRALKRELAKRNSGTNSANTD
jgi:hypothetical protein